MHVDTRIVYSDTYVFSSPEERVAENETIKGNKLMYSDCRGRLQHKGSFGFVQNAEKIVQVACLFFLIETSNAENKATVYLIFTDMPAITRTWSSSHLYSLYITVLLRLKYV